MRGLPSLLTLSALLAPGVAFADGPECPLVNLDAFGSLMNLVNIGWFLAIGVGSICVLILLSKIVEVFKAIPKEIWELIGYALGIGLVLAKFWMPESYGNTLLTVAPVAGAIIVGGMIALTGALHELKPNATAYFLTLTVLYAGLAMWYDSTPIGFLAVMALMSLLGFTVMSEPLSIGVGFEKEDRVPRTTIVAVLMLAGVLLVSSQHIELGQAKVFELGATWMGSIVAGIGLLILASKWYKYEDEGTRRPFYVLMQFVTIGLYFAGIYFGALCQNDVVMYTSLVCLVIFLFEKPHEWVGGIMAHAFVGLIMSALIGYGAFYLQNNLDTVQALLVGVRS